ncbi:hypothetical protein PHAVU_009G256700 [Phaseolus vulgaris]|uniref:Uncharacterized protein n=1 Tax=Phaseolus vulgaris TaxID=3885 RepID=V7B292_PHAVU|nr:hypothetical protein PHAVU_009G256700g [Phaseolus vulgaris]ESW10998.1 hypothetical protein PHAVU_009G256700g [Phaseolus vulgaris]
MGTGYSSHTNLGSECSSYDAGESGSIVRLGDSFEVLMSHNKNDHTEVWGVQYNTSDQKKNNCRFSLAASHDKNGVESIELGLRDHADNKTDFTLNITRIGRVGLQGGISGIISCNGTMSFTRAKQDHTIETTIVPSGCSFREGLFVLEMKKKVNSEHAYMVNMAHYYVTKDVGLSVEAKIYRSKKCFRVEVEGPFIHPSDELRWLLVKTRRTGIWSRSACSHCYVAKAKSGESNSSLKAKPSGFSSSIKQQYNRGLINSSGYTTGSLNNSVFFIDCNF